MLIDFLQAQKDNKCHSIGRRSLVSDVVRHKSLMVIFVPFNI